jgi:hypothetical protein
VSLQCSNAAHEVALHTGAQQDEAHMHSSALLTAAASCCAVPCCVVQAPILVEQGLLRVMECALWADTSFLAGLGVMDYSLLVGESSQQHCRHCSRLAQGLECSAALSSRCS